MKKLIVFALTVGMMLAFMPTAQAVTTTGRNGKNYEFTTCDHNPNEPSKCVFVPFDNGDLKVTTSFARAQVFYEIPRPTGADFVGMKFSVVNKAACDAANADLIFYGMNSSFATVAVHTGKKGGGPHHCRIIRVEVVWSP